MQIATNPPSAPLYGLNTPQVWDTDRAFLHLQALGMADSKRTAERRLHALQLLPPEQQAPQLCDESGQMAHGLVLAQEVAQARRQRKRVLFVQSAPLPDGQACLHANDARGARYWLPLGQSADQPVPPERWHQALQQLQADIGKALAVFPHGELVAALRHDPGLAHVTVCPTAYHPVPQPLDTPAAATPLPPDLAALEADSIYLLREAIAEGKRPIMRHSLDPNSCVLLHLARKAFYPSAPPFSLLHIDTRWQFRDMIAFREQMAGHSGMHWQVHIHPEAIAQHLNPFDHGAAYTQITSTDALAQALDLGGHDIVLSGTPLDHEAAVAQGPVWAWRHTEQPPAPRPSHAAPWNLFNTRPAPGERLLVLPLFRWTPLDIWRYIAHQGIPVVPLCFARLRPVVRRNGQLIMVDDERFRLQPGEEILHKTVRFAALGCYPLTPAIESQATTAADIVQELQQLHLSTPSEQTLDGVGLTPSLWHQSPNPLNGLDNPAPDGDAPDARLVFPVQWVHRPDADVDHLSGTVAEGQVAVGDRLRVTASGAIATVTDIVTFDGPLRSAEAGRAVTLRLDRHIGATRGDVLARAHQPLEMSDQLEATVVWLHPAEGHSGRHYELHLSTQRTQAAITGIKHRINPQTLAHEASKSLQLNDTSVCTLSTARPVVLDRYEDSPTLGSFILVDPYTHTTVATGKIRHSLRRARNVHRQALSIGRREREQLNAHRGAVVWFTGLSGSGKSTLANALEVELHHLGRRTYLLDGDNIRQGLNQDLGFTEADRVENIRRIAEVAKLMMDAGLIVLTAFISPFRRDRAVARERIGEADFIEVHVSTPLEVCEQRDVKGLYRRARAGEIPNMTGINSPYEAPEQPSCTLDASHAPLDELVHTLIRILDEAEDRRR